MTHPLFENIDRVNRRQLFGSAASGVGLAALARLMTPDQAPANETKPGSGGLPGLPHFPPKAKRVVVLWQGGGPSHVDLFDDKPKMREMVGQNIPDSIRGTTRLSTMSSGYAKWPCLPAIKPHKAYGQSGIVMSEMLPNVGALADNICLVRSMHTEAVNHAPGVTFFMTGSQVPGRPSLGAWLSYGLGSVTDNLPTFVVMTSSDKGKTCGQLFFDYYWGSGFLPSRFQYEMAFRMQSSVPDLVDFSNETKATLERYGPDALVKGTFANNCLITRRLLERGVSFVQLMHAGWDQHNNLFTQLEAQCRDTEGPSAALVMDLKERGMLDDTLVIWGGEFGRTPFGQGDSANPRGRDHFGRAYSWWLAGGGIKPGSVYGATDDFGWNITADPVHVHDMQATVLHLCGIDHTRLTFRYQGRQYRLTDVHGEVVKGILG